MIKNIDTLPNSREEAERRENAPPIGLRAFRGMPVLEQFPTRGAEADIYLLRDEARDKCVLKLYRHSMEPKPEVLERVREISRTHPDCFVVFRDAGFDETAGRWFELLEYLPLGSLKDLPVEVRRNPEFIKDLVVELAEAIRCLHENGIVHCDIKPGNVLVRSLDPLDLVLTDFGIASPLNLDASRRMTVLKGTPMYRPPEAFSRMAGRPGDWWGLGMIALELLTGEHPFAGLSEAQILHALTVGNVEVPERVGAEWRPLLRGLLAKDDSRRWGHAEVSRWLAGERDIPVYRETASPSESFVHPFRFEGREYRDPKALIRAFCENGEIWKRAVKYLDYLRPWMEENGWTGQPGNPGEPLSSLLAVMKDRTPAEQSACADALHEPGRFIWPRDADTRSLERVLGSLVKMRTPPVRFDAWQSLEAQFLLPSGLSILLESTTTYADALKRLRELRERDLLIPVSFAAHPLLSDGLTLENCEAMARLAYWDHTPENLTRLNTAIEGLRALARIPGFRRRSMLLLGAGRLESLTARRISFGNLRYLDGILEPLETRYARPRFGELKTLLYGLTGGFFFELPLAIGRLIGRYDLILLTILPLCIYSGSLDHLRPGSRDSAMGVNEEWPAESAFAEMLGERLLWLTVILSILPYFDVPCLDLFLFAMGFIFGILLHRSNIRWARKYDCVQIAIACSFPFEDASDKAREPLPVIDF